MKVTRIRDKLKRNEKWQIEYLTPSSFLEFIRDPGSITIK